MIDNSRARIPITSIVVLASHLVASPIVADGPVLSLRAMAIGPSAVPLTIDLFRWSTEEERAPLIRAISEPPSPPPPATAPVAAAGRGGRGGRGPAAPPTPLAKLTAAIKAAPTVGFLWGTGPTGYSIKYAWHSAPSGDERIVLVTDRRVGAHEPLWPQGIGASTDADFTVIEIRVDGKGIGEGKASLTNSVVVDTATKTLALEGYSTAPALLKVTR